MNSPIKVTPPLVTLLATNIVVIVFALVQGWDAYMLLWVYLGQSGIIGICHAFRMLVIAHAERSRRVDFFWENYGTVVFFVVHFGFFHLLYLFFLWDGGESYGMSGGSAREVLVAIGLFAVNHIFSLWSTIRADLAQGRNIGLLLFVPYVRIVPMHLAILFGTMMPILFPFLVLKVVADVAMQEVERRMLVGHVK